MGKFLLSVMQALNTYGMIEFVMGEMIASMEKMNNNATRVRFFKTLRAQISIL